MDDIKYGEILEPGTEDDQRRREEKVRSKFWPTLKKAARAVPYMDDLVAAYYCAMDPQTPSKVRGTLLAALAYFVLPLDFIPDFIISIGFGDDMAVLAMAIAAVRGHITDAHRSAAKKALADDEDLSGNSENS